MYSKLFRFIHMCLPFDFLLMLTRTYSQKHVDITALGLIDETNQYL